MKDNFWIDFYKNSNAPQFESPFAREINGKLQKNSSILDFGCGNGRDTFYFLSKGHEVVGLDACETALSSCRSKGCGTFVDFPIHSLGNNFTSKFDVFYSRFSLHALTQDYETELLKQLPIILKKNSMIAIECRSIHDELYGAGKNVGEHEFITDHYRRFLVPKDLFSRLSSYVDITYFEVSKGFAKFKDEDPCVIRIIGNLL